MDDIQSLLKTLISFMKGSKIFFEGNITSPFLFTKLLHSWQSGFSYLIE